MTSIRASKIVTPDKVISNGYLIFDESSGLITELSEDKNFATDVSTNATLIPGFVDIHCHGGGGYSFDDVSQVSQAANFHLQHGTTSQIASLVSAPVAKQVLLLKSLSQFVADDVIAGVHLEGPFLSSAKCGAQNPAFLTSPDKSSVDSILAAANGTLKLITIAPELENALSAIETFVANKITVALGHSDALAQDAIAGVDAGASLVTHLFNAMRPSHHRDSGLTDLALTDSRLSVEVILDGKHVSDLSVALAHTVKGPKFIAITDAISAAGMPDGEYDLGGLMVSCKNDEAVISGTKTLAGSTLTMAKVFDRLLNVYGFEIFDAVWATSTAAAKAINLPDVGAIEVGKKANFILWNDGIRSVYKNGNLVR